MRSRLAVVLLSLVLLGCSAGSGDRAARATPQPDPTPQPAPPPALDRVDYGGLRQETGPWGPVWLLPATPRIEVRVRNTPAVAWWLYPATGTPGPDPLAVLTPELIRDGVWVLNWESPPHEPVALHLMAQLTPEHTDASSGGEPVWERGGERWLTLAQTLVRALAPGESPYITAEQALTVARAINPEAFWRARLDEGLASEGKEGRVVRPAWVVEAIHRYGNRTRVAVDARTGRQLGVMQAEAPHFPDPPRRVDCEQAVAAALAALAGASPGGSGLNLGAVTFHEGYRLERPPASQVYDLWVVQFISRSDGRPAGQVLVHGYTGEVLDWVGFSSPP